MAMRRTASQVIWVDVPVGVAEAWNPEFAGAAGDTGRLSLGGPGVWSGPARPEVAAWELDSHSGGPRAAAAA